MTPHHDVSIMEYCGIAPTIAPNAFIAPGARICGDVHIGKDSSVWFNVVIRGDVNFVRIGNQSNIQDNAVVHVTGGGLPTHIGDRVTVGHQAMIHACNIEDGALIGMGATILDGAVIGKHCLVGAGSLVTQNKRFEPESLIMGSPAKVVRRLTTAEIDQLEASADRYVEIASNYQRP